MNIIKTIMETFRLRDFESKWLKGRRIYFDGLYHEMKYLNKKAVFAGKRIAVVGCWNNIMEISKIMNKLGLCIDIIADNNVNKQGVSRLGIVSQSVESLAWEHKGSLLILVLNNIFWRDLRAQLLDLNLIEGEDFLVLFGGRRIEKAERRELAAVPSSREWRNFCKTAARGYNDYKDILNKYPDMPIWLMHQPSLGDLHIFSLFLPVAMGVKTIGECQCVLIVTKNSVRKYAEAIGYKYIEMITFESVHRKWLPMMRVMPGELSVYNAVYHGLNTIFQSLVWNTPVTFRDSFTKYVFPFKSDVSPIFIQLPKRREHVSEFFIKLGIIPGKTVLISPYAGHFDPMISDAQWERLVTGLTDKGYSVCTNCGGSDELPLKNTVPAFIDLQDCVEFAEMAGYFIGVRSGFCDLVCNAECLKIVIYETGAPAAAIDFFGLANMGISDDVIEVINDCSQTDSLIDEIIGYF